MPSIKHQSTESLEPFLTRNSSDSFVKVFIRWELWKHSALNNVRMALSVYLVHFSYARKGLCSVFHYEYLTQLDCHNLPISYGMNTWFIQSRPFIWWMIEMKSIWDCCYRAVLSSFFNARSNLSKKKHNSTELHNHERYSWIKVCVVTLCFKSHDHMPLLKFQGLKLALFSRVENDRS